jgi:hypothetical protein
MKINIFGIFMNFYEFPTQFPNTISKASTLCSAKDLSQEDSKITHHVLQGVKKAPFHTLNAIILQSMWSTFLKLFALSIGTQLASHCSPLLMLLLSSTLLCAHPTSTTLFLVLSKQSVLVLIF